MKVAYVPAVLVALLIGGAGCAAEQPTQVVLPPSGELVAKWNVTGGIAPIGLGLADAPRLVVYADGRAITDARRVLMLPTDEVRSLVGDLRTQLKGLTTKIEPENAKVSDGQNTELQVYAGDGRMQIVNVYALGVVDGFPASLIAANQRMADLAGRVANEGSVYIANRVRLMARPVSRSDDMVGNWPATIPVPVMAGMSDPARVSDLDGEAAVAVVHAFPGAQVAGGTRDQRRLPDGTIVDVLWRYLLPDE